MRELSERATDKIANNLKLIMKEKKVKANQILVNTDLGRNQVYSVLKMGKIQRPNYSIDTLLTVCRFLGVNKIDL